MLLEMAQMWLAEQAATIRKVMRRVFKKKPGRSRAAEFHVTLLGGGFGRKSKCDYAIEAALLSKAVGGSPVKVRTREDDIRSGDVTGIEQRLGIALFERGDDVG